MPEPMIPVPVSLIEEADRYIDGLGIKPNSAQANWARVGYLAGRAHALLSQPTPTAEPECTCGWGGVHDPDNPRCDQYAEPPRIENRAPGTRAALERADLVLGGFVQHDWSSSMSVGEWYLGELRKLRDAIDPSTIRDVTPPPVTS